MKKRNYSQPAFSILLPTHNRADVLSYAIESVLGQTETNFELLIVGDGCSDNTADVVSPYLSDPRGQWFDFPKGPGFGYDHRNKIFKLMHGGHVAFVGHDDILFPDHLQLLGRRLDSQPQIDIVYSRPLWISPDGRIMPSAFNTNHHQMAKFFLERGNAIPATCF